MERVRINRKPSAILCSDFHLREDTPTCWTGDFQGEQWKAVDFIYDLQKKYDRDVIHAGDLFHHWKSSPWLLSMAIQHLPNKFWTIFGQHDLPQHNLELVEKCGVQTLHLAQSLTLLPGCHWGQEPEGYLPWYDKKLLIWHYLTYIKKPFPGATGGMAEGVLRKYSQFDLIVTGDNHASFTIEYQGRRLVNPGSLTRQTADQIDFQPRVALWYAEDNSIQWVNLPIKQDVISRGHIEVKEQRDKRIEAFISRLDSDWQVELSFEENLNRFFEANNIKESVKQIIYKSIEYEPKKIN
jgi:DNA repair exonuclease SbcCD nuclease subunit